ncbi:MAG: HlyD family type I secretion periplasmic adaptor subunit [Alphaproteobacteria bacterium]
MTHATVKHKLHRAWRVLNTLQRHPHVRKAQELADHIVQVSTHREYNGQNPAIAAMYGPMRVSLLVMLALFLVIFVLGTLVPIESAAVATGTISVLTNKKTVQHYEGGIIREILVKEGDTVTAGEKLIILNDVAPKASQSVAKNEWNIAKATEARLLALKNDKEQMQVPDNVSAAAQHNKDLAKAVATQQDLFNTQRETQATKLQTLQQRIEQQNEEIKGLEAQVKSAEGQLALIAQEIEPTERLVEKGYASRPQLLALQRQREELEGNRGQYISSIAKARQSITEAELQIANLKNEFSTEVADELKDAQAQIADLEEKLRATSDVLDRTVITAPYEGVVTGLQHHTVGGVIAPGTSIMDIVPQEEQLIVEAQVSPTDIDVVEEGLDTRIVFSAYKTRSMPRLTGTVTQVSADAFSDAHGPMPTSYYRVKVEVNQDELKRLDKRVRLYPGMPVEVYIHTGSRSFLGYLFAPVTASLHKAFRED